MKPMAFANIIFNLNINDSFTYRIPDEIDLVPAPGQRVLAPFGNRVLTGIVAEILPESGINGCKNIIDFLDEKPLISPEMMMITRWIAEYYACPWGQTVQLAVPKGLERESVTYIFLNEYTDHRQLDLSEKQKYLYDIISRDPGKPVSFYKQKFGVGAVAYFLRILEKKELIEMHTEISGQKIRKKNIQTILVNSTPPDDLKRVRNKEEVLHILRKFAGQKVILEEFISQTGISRARIKRFSELGLITLKQEETHRGVTFTYTEKQKNIDLNEKQRTALAEITGSLRRHEYGVFLIHGVTGSGKTQVYLESIKKARESGRTAIVLIPEISLTPQTVKRFENFFPDQVAVFHSKMSLGERYDVWRKVNEGTYSIAVGPRSALFMPLENLGIVVVDEEHDNSYKQSAGRPRYHARDVAIYRARMNNAVVLLGSATPSMESYYNTQIKKYRLLNLPDRIRNIPMPQVTVVDMARGRRKKGGSGILSELLINKIQQRLRLNEQIILLQNRRGFASFMQCVDCGYIPQCPRCAISLTYHSYTSSLQCHYCGYRTHAADTCSKCEGRQLKYKGSGTQKVEKEIHRLIPQARVLRMDQDTTTGKGAHDKYLQAFRESQFDVLLGTQMISKGLDFPNVTLVGVIAAEIGLSIPDFRAAERVFQLLTQVAGRAGRDERTGEVIIQSYLENHYALQYARNHDFIGFYDAEIKHRKQLNYPPYTRMIAIRVSGDNLKKTIQHSREIGAKLRRLSRHYYDVIGPAPSPLAVLKNMYRWQLLLKLNPKTDPAGKETKRIIIKHLEYYLRSYKSDTKVIIDVDPVEML